MKANERDILAEVGTNTEQALHNIEEAIHNVGDLHTRAALVAWEQLLAWEISSYVNLNNLKPEELKDIAKVAWMAAGIFAEESKHHAPPEFRVPEDPDDGCDLSIMPQVEPYDQGGA